MHEFDGRLFFLLLDYLLHFFASLKLSGFSALSDLLVVSACFSFFSFLLRLRDNNGFFFLFFHLLHDLAAWFHCYLFLIEIEQKMRMRLFQILIFVVRCRSAFLRNSQKYQRHCIFPYFCRMLQLKDLQDSRLLTFVLPLQKHKIMKDKG